MAEFPALPLWTDAYLGDTTHLTTIEHGAYLLLLMTAWRSRDCRLPDDDKLLARYARCGPNQWKRLRPVLEPFFVIENGQWWQRRLTDEASAVRQKKQQASIAGRASALKRQDRHSTGVQPKSNEPPTQLQLEPNITNTITSKVPLDKESNGEISIEEPDPEKDFWDTAKSFLSRQHKNPGALVGKWLRDHGKEETARALTAAQIEHAVDPIAYIEGYFRKHGAAPQMERPIC